MNRFTRTLAAAFYTLLVGVIPALPQAALIPNAKQTFVDENGKPLTGGKVYNYVPSTVVPKTTWSDSTELTPNTNPVTLDAAGRGVIYGQGNYQQKVTKSDGTLVWSAPTTAINSSPASGANGTDTAPIGTIVAYSGLVPPTNWQFAYGQALNRVDFADLMVASTISSTVAACTFASATISGWTDTSQMRVGAPVEASCLPPNTVILKILNSTQILVSNNATVTQATTATVFPWGNGDGVSSFNVPDLRGRVAAGPDNMGGPSAARMTQTTTITTVSGNPIATVASASGLYAGMYVVSTNVPAGTTVTQIAGTTVTLSINPTASASGTAVTFFAFNSTVQGASGGSGAQTLAQTELPQALGVATSTVNDPGHTHNPRASGSAANSSDPTGNFFATGTGIYRTSGAGAPISMGTTTSNTTGITISSTITNNLSINTTLSTTNASPTATVGSAAGLYIGMTVVCAPAPLACSVPAGATIAAISGTTVTLSVNATATTAGAQAQFQIAAGGNAHSAFQPTVVVNYIIKVKASTTGLGGITSIQGMFGDILCGVGVDCTNNIISFAGTPSLLNNFVYVGNASNLPVGVAMTGDCTIVASGQITCTKSTPSVLYVTTAGTIPVGNTISRVVINKGVPSATPLTLGAVVLRNNLPLQVFDFAGTGGDITLTPNAGETIMGVATWTVTSGGVAGSGGSVLLYPDATVNGWLTH